MHRRLIEKNAGVTLPELLVAVALVAILLVVLSFFLRPTLLRARDAQRKGDLEKIKIAFENYFNDYGCYPEADVLNNCRGTSFRPYLDTIPCDPLTKAPYLYAPLADRCKGYRVYTGLEDTNDPVIPQLNCQGADGCGPGAEYTYGISVGTSVEGGSAPAPATPTPSSTPSGPIYVYACDSAGVCNQFEEGHPFLVNCPVTFPASNCNNQCVTVANRCH
jgi:prepilin-type N-terminal cleavage/methylation domain-containing protein